MSGAPQGPGPAKDAGLSSHRSPSGHLEAILSAPRQLQEGSKRPPNYFFSAPKASKSDPRAIQEAFSCHHAAKRHSEPCFINVDPEKVTPGPQKSKNYEKNKLFWRSSVFRSSRLLDSDSMLDPLGLTFGGPLAPKRLKPLLECLLERPRAVQDHFFPAPKGSKSGPRHLQDCSKSPPRAQEAPR